MLDRLDSDTIRAFPKLSLHDHLDGGLRPATVIELADAQGSTLPANDPEALAEWAVRACSGSLEDYLAVSDLLVHLLAGDPDALHRVGREFVLDLFEDGVIYAEVRWAPEEMAVRGLSTRAALDAVTAGLREGVDEVRALGGDIHVEQILCALRSGSAVPEIATLAVERRGHGVVGFDLAGAESGFPASLHRATLDMLAADGMPVTLHAGEAAGVESIRSALDDGRAVRIGHGVRLAEDISDDGTLGPVARIVRERGVVLEVCPTSNLQTGASRGSIMEHPFDRLLRAGLPVTVSPDNRLLSGTDVTAELTMLADAFSYEAADIAHFQLTAVDGAFLPEKERSRLRTSIRAALRKSTEVGAGRV